MRERTLARCSEKKAAKDEGKKSGKKSKVFYLPHFVVLKKTSKRRKKKIELKKAAEDVVVKRPSVRRTRIIRRTRTTTTTISIPVYEEEEEQQCGNKKKNRKICIYFSALSNDFNTVEWFKINPHKAINDVTKLTPFCSMPSSVPQRGGEFGAVGLDSKLYVMGGYDQYDTNGEVPSSKVFVYDTSTTNPTWEECCSMNSPRSRPAAAAVDGLIYALGSHDDNRIINCDPYAEVFDPSKNSWSSLPPPSDADRPPPASHSTFSQDRGEILMFSYGNQVYSFHPRNRIWKRIPIPIGRIVTYNTRYVCVGDVIFTFYKDTLYACDLSQTTPSVEAVNGLEEATASIVPECSEMTVNLFYIGNGKMCLLWEADSLYSNNAMVITCVKFWVGTRDEGSRLRAVVDRTEQYLADGKSITACVAM